MKNSDVPQQPTYSNNGIPIQNDGAPASFAPYNE